MWGQEAGKGRDYTDHNGRHKEDVGHAPVSGVDDEQGGVNAQRRAQGEGLKQPLALEALLEKGNDVEYAHGGKGHVEGDEVEVVQGSTLLVNHVGGGQEDGGEDAGAGGAQVHEAVPRELLEQMTAFGRRAAAVRRLLIGQVHVAQSEKEKKRINLLHINYILLLMLFADVTILANQHEELIGCVLRKAFETMQARSIL